MFSWEAARLTFEECLVAAIGKFDVLKPLGKGAGSTIFKVRCHADGKVYALKVIVVGSKDDHKYVEQVEHEFAIISTLNHPGIVKAFACERTKRLFWTNGARLLLEFVDGLPLSECTSLPMPRLVSVFTRLSAALQYLHEKGYFHADIKPDNVMIAGDHGVKLIDFGLAWRKGESKNRVQGTLEYLAPEQASKKIVNERTDIFNFGATMYRVLTGRSLPNLRDHSIKKIKRADDLVRPLCELKSSIPLELDELVRRCVRIDPKERPRTMAEVRAALEHLVGDVA